MYTFDYTVPFLPLVEGREKVKYLDLLRAHYNWVCYTRETNIEVHFLRIICSLPLTRLIVPPFLKIS